MRKILVALLLFGLLYSVMIQNVRGTPYISGWIGKYLSLKHITVDPNPYEIKANENITFEIWFLYYREMFVKTIHVSIDIWGDVVYNETLVKDTTLVMGNFIAGAVYKVVEVDPPRDGALSFHVYANYQYDEGNQAFEQQGSIDLINIMEVPTKSYVDMQSENAILRNQIYDLNSSLRTLNASYSDLRGWTYLLAFTTCTLIIATLLGVIIYKKRYVKPPT